MTRQLVKPKILRNWQALWLYPRAAMGDPIAFERLLGSVYYLIVKYAGYYSGRYSKDELMAEGIFGFVCGVSNRRWNPERSAFVTYIHYYIRGAMLVVLTRDNKMVGRKDHHEGPKTFLMGDFFGDFGDSSASFDHSRDHFDVPDTRGPTDLSLDDKERLVKVMDCLDHINPKYATCVKCRFLDGMTLKQVSEIMGVSRERVRQLTDLGLADIRSAVISQERRTIVDPRS